MNTPKNAVYRRFENSADSNVWWQSDRLRRGTSRWLGDCRPQPARELEMKAHCKCISTAIGRHRMAAEQSGPGTAHMEQQWPRL